MSVLNYNHVGRIFNRSHTLGFLSKRSYSLSDLWKSRTSQALLPGADHQQTAALQKRRRQTQGTLVEPRDWYQ